MPFDIIEEEIQNLTGTPITTRIVDATTANTAIVDSSGALKVTGGGGGEEHLQGDSIIGAKGTGILGSDGTLFKWLKLDSSGQLIIGSLPAISLVSQPNPFTSDIPVSAKIKDGAGNDLSTVNVNGNRALCVEQVKKATFIAYANDMVVGNNKSMISIFNAVGSPVKIQIQSIKIKNMRTTAVTGIISIFNLFKMTGHSAGVTWAPDAFDSVDVLNASVTVRAGATVTGESTQYLMRWKWSSDEWGVGSLDVEAENHTFQELSYAYSALNYAKPITLNAGQGIHIKHTVNGTVGTFDFEIIFTQE